MCYITLLNQTVKDSEMFGFKLHRLWENRKHAEEGTHYGELIVKFEGTLYNANVLYQEIGEDKSPENNHNALISHMYCKFGIEHTLQMLDGNFALIIMDQRLNTDESKVYVATDPLGLGEVYIQTLSSYDSSPKGDQGSMWGIGMDKHALSQVSTKEESVETNSIVALRAGCYTEFSVICKAHYMWQCVRSNYPYMIFGGPRNSNPYTSAMYTQALLEQAIKKRVDIIDSSVIGCFFNGTYESFLVVTLLNDYMKRIGKELRTYSICNEESSTFDLLSVLPSASKHTNILGNNSDPYAWSELAMKVSSDHIHVLFTDVEFTGSTGGSTGSRGFVEEEVAYKKFLTTIGTETSPFRQCMKEHSIRIEYPLLDSSLLQYKFSCGRPFFLERSKKHN